MYSVSYGFPNAAAAAGQAAFNGAPPPQNAHLQPGPAPGQPQQMMYTAQYPMGAQGPFAGAPNMMPVAGPAGMMQNAAMPHMAANGQMTYQTPYTAASYGPGIPSSAAPQPQLGPNFNMMAGPMPGFAMNAAGGMPQPPQMMQRMHPSQPNPAAMGVSTPQRQFSASHSTPGNQMPPQQPQFVSTPQASSHGTPQNQMSGNAQQQPHSAVSTPQTPTFPSGQGAGVGGGSAVHTPLSPGSESREKELFALLLEINQELLCESAHLQITQLEIKKEHAATAGGSEGNTPTSEQGRKPTEEERLLQADYVQCMRRLQTNLAFLASLADRKGSNHVPKGPLYLMPPPLNLSIKLRSPPSPQGAPPDGSDAKIDLNAEREERGKGLKDLYRRLQALFPGVDPKKEPAFPSHGQGGGSQGHNAQRMGGPQGLNQGSPPPPPQKTPQMMAMPAPPVIQAAGTM